MRRCSPLLVATALLALSLLALLGPRATAQSGPTRLFLPMIAGPAFVASYLGGPANDAVAAVELDAAGRTLLAGRWPDAQIGGVTPAPLAGGEGAVVRLGPGGRVVAAARVGGPVVDMEASAAGPIIACGSFGIAALSPELDAILWSDAPGAVTRCAAGASGGAAALVGSTIFTYAPGGTGRTSWTAAGTAAADLALDEGAGLVFVTGYTQKASNLKVAYLRAYGSGGALRWSAYDFAAAELTTASLSADSEGRRVTLGADGKLYLAGWTDGGNSLFGRDPLDLARTPGPDELVKFDAYNNPFNLSGARSLAWYGRFEPADGRLLAGQWLLTRLSDGKGNSIAIYGIDAAQDGTLALAGEAYASLPGRDSMVFGGARLGAYEGGEPYLLVVAPDFKARRLWTALAASGTSAGGSPASGVAIGDGLVLLGATLNPRASAPARGLLTASGPQQAVAGGSEGYFLLTQAP